MFYPRFPANLGLRFWVRGIELSHSWLLSIRVSLAVYLGRTRVRYNRRHLCLMLRVVTPRVVSGAKGPVVADELNIFDVAAATPTDAWAHGSAAAKAWVTGSLRAEDGLDFSGEFDAQFSAKFGADVLKGLASLSGDLTGAAHAGVRVQAGMPLDLFEVAGIVARIRLEASANARASVTAAMSAGEMRDLVIAALPAEARPYVGIVLDEVRVGATVWARAS